MSKAKMKHLETGSIRIQSSTNMEREVRSQQWKLTVDSVHRCGQCKTMAKVEWSGNDTGLWNTRKGVVTVPISQSTGVEMWESNF